MQWLRWNIDQTLQVSYRMSLASTIDDINRDIMVPQCTMQIGYCEGNNTEYQIMLMASNLPAYMGTRSLTIRYDTWNHKYAFSALHDELFWKNNTYISILCQSSKLKWWNLMKFTRRRDKKSLYCIVNFVPADSLAIRAARPSAGMVLTYCPTSNIRHTKFKDLNASCLVLQLSSPNPLKPGVKLRMKM